MRASVSCPSQLLRRRRRHGRSALSSLLLARLSLLGLLATFLSLFVGIPRGALARRLIFVGLVVFTVLLVGFSLGALRSTGGTAARLTHHLPLLGVAGAGVAVFVAALAWLAFRYPDWAMPVVLVLAPLRVGLPHGSSTSNLLIPLYLVLLAVVLAEMVVRDRLRLPDDWRPDPVRIALAVMIAIIGVSSLWAAQHYAAHPKAFADVGHGHASGAGRAAGGDHRPAGRGAGRRSRRRGDRRPRDGAGRVTPLRQLFSSMTLLTASSRAIGVRPPKPPCGR